ncbi:MAG: S46 family peptidase [Bacteroidales bacterium]
MKKINLIIISLLLPFLCFADEGMWIPSLIQNRIIDMQSKGLKISAEDIYSVNQASLKDAIVLFGHGCTGELISNEGLLITNYHCGYSQIQKHSSVKHDYLKDGFWAMNRNEELSNPGLTVSFLVRMDDVTDKVLKNYKNNMSEKQRTNLIFINKMKLIRQTKKAYEGCKINIEALYYGNQYFMFVFREYTDIRLVGAPPSSVGKFGGDTDNWMWPRHTGDFSIFRIYSNKNNNPAVYSANNVPYKPKKFLPISTKGVKEGDFTFIYGNPGSTEEYITSDAIKFIARVSNPAKIKLRTHILDAQKKYMSRDQAVRIQYSSKNASVSNSWKRWQGERKGIIEKHIIDKKIDYENNFRLWTEGVQTYEGEDISVGKKYLYILDTLSKLYEAREKYAIGKDYYYEACRPIEISNFAIGFVKNLEGYSNLNDNAENRAKNPAEKLADTFYKDYYMPIDKEVFISLLKEYQNDLPQENKAAYFNKCIKKYGTVEKWANNLYSNTIFTNRVKTLAAAKDFQTNPSVLKNDPAYKFGIEMYNDFYSRVMPNYIKYNKLIKLAYRKYMRGLMAFDKQRVFYPDANLTLRIAYGKIAGYSPKDAVWYCPVSTIEGIMQKDNPNIFDYNIPQKLRDIYAKKSYGKWAVNGSIPVCFLATNHTTGGNSGSPIINANGELIGINFDRVWEGTMSDIAFDSEICRNISLDVRYVLFYIDVMAGAHHLIDEMEIH